MVNKKFLLGMLVLTLVFGMTVVSCEDEDNPTPEEESPPFTWTPASTGSVSLSMTTRENQLSYDNKYYYTINISLNLLPLDGTAMSVAAWITKPAETIAKQWVTVTGISDLSTWTFDVGSVYPDGYAYLTLFYSSSGYTSPISISSGITATIDTAKLTEMKGYTNITNTLSAGTPTSVTKNSW